MHILDLFEKIRATNKKSEKIALLSANKDLPFLEKVIYLAHSPRVKFYIKAIPAYQSSGITSGLVSNYDFSLKRLKDIQDRVVTGSEAIKSLKELLETVSPEH